MSNDSRKRAGKWSVSSQIAIGSITILVVITLGLFACVLPYSPGGVPMQPSIDQGDYVLVSRLSYLGSSPRRGHVVVYNALHEGKSRQYMSRIIGMPGERIQILDSVIHIDGRAIGRKARVTPGRTVLTERFDENHFIERLPGGIVVPTYDYDQEDDTQVFEVPAGHYFMIGDNRNNSYDSRDSGVGPIPREEIVGRVTYVLYSWTKSKVGKRIH